jgi:hypothetical protein
MSTKWQTTNDRPTQGTLPRSSILMLCGTAAAGGWLRDSSDDFEPS